MEVKIKIYGTEARTDGEKWDSDDRQVKDMLNTLARPEDALPDYTPAPAWDMAQYAVKKFNAEIKDYEGVERPKKKDGKVH